MNETIESVVTVLERELTATIERWMKRVAEVPALGAVALNYQERTGHLPQLLEDLILRLGLPHGTARPHTSSAHDHGKVRFNQCYTVPMLVEESRILQVSIFDTLRLNQKVLAPDEIMISVITIADECDAQLKDTVETFMTFEKSRIVTV